MQYITRSIIRAIAAHEVMRAQAGNRMIVSFRIEDGDNSHTRTSHYGTCAAVVAEWDRLIARYGEENVAMSSAHAEAITAFINNNK